MEPEKDNARKPSDYKNIAISGQRIKMAAEIGMAQSSSTDRQWSHTLCHRLVHHKKPEEEEASKGFTDNSDDQDEEEVETEKKVTALKKLIPGGEDILEMDALLDETADYIKALRGQVNLMRALDQTIEERKMRG